jgi:uncharacterized protein with FMN-binding domain
MIFGIVTAVFIVLSVVTGVLARRHGKTVRTLHLIFGILAVLSCAIHLIITLPLFESRPWSVWITGFWGLAILLLLALSGVLKWKKFVKFHRMFAVAAILILILHVTCNVIALNDYRAAAASIEVDEIDLSQIQDGEYIGECDIGYVYAKVRVSIASGGIMGIEILEHRTERGAAAERIVADMEARQKITVDAVTGATNSSNVIKKAVYNALQGGF